MTALDAVSWVDGKQHNVFSLTDKLLWLSQVEAEVRALWSRCGKNVPPEDYRYPRPSGTQTFVFRQARK